MIWIILLFGLVLRLLSINQSFWLDEATSANTVRDFSFGDIITKFSPNDFHPPLYYLVLKAWTISFGVSEISIRMLSVIFGLGTIYLVYLITLEIFKKSKTVATLAALLMATAPLHIYYSQEARMYAMETFLVVLSFLSFVKITKEGRAGWWIVFAITLAFVGLTDYLPLLILPVFWIYGRPQFLTSHIILIISYVWWWPTLIQQLSRGLEVATSLPGWWSILGKTSLKEILLVPVKFMIGRVGFDNKLLYGLTVGMVGIMFGYLLFLGLRKTSRWLGLWLVIPVALAAVIGLKVPVFSYFRLLFVLPAFYILVAVGLSKVKEKYFPLFLMVVVSLNIIFSATYLLNPRFHREDWRGLVGALGSRENVVAVFPAQSQREAFLYYGGKEKIVEPEDLSGSHKEIWLLRYVTEITDPNEAARKKIEDLGYNKTSEENYNGVVVWKYANSN